MRSALARDQASRRSTNEIGSEMVVAILWSRVAPRHGRPLLRRSHACILLGKRRRTSWEMEATIQKVPRGPRATLNADVAEPVRPDIPDSRRRESEAASGLVARVLATLPPVISEQHMRSVFPHGTCLPRCRTARAACLSTHEQFCAIRLISSVAHVARRTYWRHGCPLMSKLTRRLTSSVARIALPCQSCCRDFAIGTEQ